MEAQVQNLDSMYKIYWMEMLRSCAMVDFGCPMSCWIQSRLMLCEFLKIKESELFLLEGLDLTAHLDLVATLVSRFV